MKKKNAPYRSGLEVKIAAQLTGKKVKFTYEKLRVKYQKKMSVYTPDFQLPSGVIVEAKGRFVSADRAKHLSVKEQHPELDIRFVFYRDQTLSKQSSTMYSEWCNKHGFLWAIKEIPTSWIKEKQKKKKLPMAALDVAS